MTDPIRLSRALRACREEAGLSRAEVAERVYGTPELADLIGDLEEGRVDAVSLTFLLRLTAVLGVTLAELSARAWRDPPGGQPPDL